MFPEGALMARTDFRVFKEFCRHHYAKRCLLTAIKDANPKDRDAFLGKPCRKNICPAYIKGKEIGGYIKMGQVRVRVRSRVR